MFGSALVDLIGMKRMLLLSALGRYRAGAAGLLAATTMPVNGAVQTVILVSLLLTGLGWGAVEAASTRWWRRCIPRRRPIDSISCTPGGRRALW
ncbi:MAG: hypothetical protein IPG64_20090 [Haliea sp.]|nr:hypothetical protein [Haliea sp.]